MQSALIWDLDGTLIDSYQTIVDCLLDIVKNFHLQYEPEYIYKFIKETSVHNFLQIISKNTGTNFNTVKARYSEISNHKGTSKIREMPDAHFVLDSLTKMKVNNFIFTHKGLSTLDVLKEFNLDRYFVEIVTSNNGLARKPNPEALTYIIDKYKLSHSHTYYIGDRAIDIECAKNAGIKSIFFADKSSINIDADFTVYQLISLLDIFH